MFFALYHVFCLFSIVWFHLQKHYVTFFFDVLKFLHVVLHKHVCFMWLSLISFFNQMFREDCLPNALHSIFLCLNAPIAQKKINFPRFIWRKKNFSHFAKKVEHSAGPLILSANISWWSHSIHHQSLRWKPLGLQVRLNRLTAPKHQFFSHSLFPRNTCIGCWSCLSRETTELCCQQKLPRFPALSSLCCTHGDRYPYVFSHHLCYAAHQTSMRWEHSRLWSPLILKRFQTIFIAWAYFKIITAFDWLRLLPFLHECEFGSVSPKKKETAKRTAKFFSNSHEAALGDSSINSQGRMRLFHDVRWIPMLSNKRWSACFVWCWFKPFAVRSRRHPSKAGIWSGRST